MASSVWKDNKVLKKWVEKKQKNLFDGNFNFDMNNLYSDPLLNEISKKLGIDKEYIYLGAGSSQFIPTILSLKCWKKVYISTPEFGLYDRGVKIIANNYEEIFSKTCDDFIRKFKKVKSSKNDLLVISSPRWFSGEMFTEKQVSEILNFFKGTIFIDEAYVSFSENPNGLMKMALSNERLIILRSFSKKYFLSGIRVGYMVTKKKIAGFRDTIVAPHSISTYSARFCVELLKDEKILNIFKNTIEYMKLNRNYIYDSLCDNDNLQIIFSEANFITIIIKNKDYYDKCCLSLSKIPGIQFFLDKKLYFIKIWIADHKFSNIIVEKIKKIK